MKQKENGISWCDYTFNPWWGCVLDLCCGLGGWAEGLIASGWDVIGVDTDPRFIGRYPGRLVLADILNLTFSPRAKGRFQLRSCERSLIRRESFPSLCRQGRVFHPGEEGEA